MVGSSYNSHFQDDFFKDSIRFQRTIGIIFLVLSAISLIIGTVLCIYLCNNVSRLSDSPSNTQPGVIYQSNVVYGPKSGIIATPYGNSAGGGQQQIHPTPQQGNDTNISSYPSTYSSTVGQNLSPGAAYQTNSGFSDYQQKQQNIGQSDGPIANQDLSTNYPYSTNVNASAPFNEQNNSDPICPPSYIEATTQ